MKEILDLIEAVDPSDTDALHAIIQAIEWECSQ